MKLNFLHLQGLFGAITEVIRQPISPKKAFKFCKALDKLETEYRVFQNSRKVITDKYISPDTKKIKDGMNEEDYKKEIDELNSCEIDIVFDNPVELNSLEEDGVKITPISLKLLIHNNIVCE
jgi:hypothetical protein